MNRLILQACALIGGFPLLLSAQSPTPREVPSPQPPLVAVPRPGTQWSVSVKYSAEASPATSHNPVVPKGPVLLQYRCAQEVTLVLAKWLDGTLREGYVAKGQVILQDLKQGGCYTTPLQDNDPDLPIFVSGYPGTAWIALRDYKGTEMIGNDLCYRFFRDVDRTNPALPVHARTAWIRVQDKAPIRVQLGEIFYSFSPVETDPVSISIPREVQSFLGELGRSLDALKLLMQMNRNQ